MLVRLNKHLADLGHASRRGAEALIASGRVRINGKVVTEPVVKRRAKPRNRSAASPV
jgi:16S rRNA U516 pseudouridylate synthase RsuA-like enzyme